MNKDEKLQVFSKHLGMIASDGIRDFTKFCILNFPDYVWTMPSSTSGRRHGGEGETLLDHIQGCLYLAECVIEQFSSHWKQKQKDQLISALILHDGWRAHSPDGKIRRFTEEDVIENPELKSKVGNVRTDPEHPESGYRQLLKLQLEFNKIAEQENKKPITTKDFSIIAKGTRCHYGPFTKTPDVPFSLDYPYSSVVIQVHNIDYMEAKCSMYYKRILKEEK